MKTYLDCWISAATALFSQALAGEPELTATALDEPDGTLLAYVAQICGDLSGRFTVMLDPAMVASPLLGEGTDQAEAWAELLREVAESAAAEMLAVEKKNSRVESCQRTEPGSSGTRGFLLTSPGYSWPIRIQDEVRDSSDCSGAAKEPVKSSTDNSESGRGPGLQLLLDVELEATLRFGCCEMPLGEILELGPGDVVELDRNVSDPVDLVVGDKIVARGEVVLVNGNFGLSITEVSTPRHRLESIRCLF